MATKKEALLVAKESIGPHGEVCYHKDRHNASKRRDMLDRLEVIKARRDDIREQTISGHLHDLLSSAQFVTDTIDRTSVHTSCGKELGESEGIAYPCVMSTVCIADKTAMSELIRKVEISSAQVELQDEDTELEREEARITKGCMPRYEALDFTDEEPKIIASGDSWDEIIKTLKCMRRVVRDSSGIIVYPTGGKS